MCEFQEQIDENKQNSSKYGTSKYLNKKCEPSPNKRELNVSWVRMSNLNLYCRNGGGFLIIVRKHLQLSKLFLDQDKILTCTVVLNKVLNKLY